MRSKNNSKLAQNDNHDPESFFGFKQVSFKQKYSLVQNVFSSVASKYDVMNNLMSLGVHYLWKKEMLKLLPNFGSLLDVAGGTGDIARLYYLKAQQQNIEPDVVIYDFNLAMLKACRANLIDSNIISGISLICGDALALPFSENSFDYYTIAFGIRNVVDIKQVLSEALRVLKPGGKFVCLEFSKVHNDLLSRVYDIYSFSVIPTIGAYVANDRESYQYLVESIKKFPNQKDFLQLIEQAGFINSGYKNLTFGVTALHHGYKAE